MPPKQRREKKHNTNLKKRERVDSPDNSPKKCKKNTSGKRPTEKELNSPFPLGTKIKNSYSKHEEEVFEEIDGSVTKIKCRICGVEVLYKNRKTHLQTAKHGNIIQLAYPEMIQTYEELMKSFSVNNQSVEQSVLKKLMLQRKSLDFLCRLVSLGLSFLQIQNIYEHCQKNFEELENCVLKEIFSQKVYNIQDIILQLGSELKQQLLEKLKSHYYSLTIDTSTITGVQVCIIRVRFAVYENNKLTINNNLLALKDMGDSCKSDQYLYMLKEELFNTDELKRNFIGLSHDSANVLEGSKKGLIGLLREEINSQILNVPDPAHIMSKSIEKAIPLIPDKIMDLVSSLNNFFHYRPCQQAKLKKVQQDNQLIQKKIVAFITTRWNSLYQSIESILQIWSSLELFFENSTTSQEKKIYSLIQDPSLKEEISYYNAVLKIISGFILKFQERTPSILDYNQSYKSLLMTLYSFVIKQEILETTNIDELLRKFEDDIFNEILCSGSTTISKIQEWITDSIKQQNQTENVGEQIQKFILKILSYLQKKFLTNHPILQNIDFLDFTIPPLKFQEKILNLYNSTNIFNQIDKSDLMMELTLFQNSTQSQFWKGNNIYNNLETWYQIQCQYQNLGKMAKMCQSFPFSSTDVEQSFSTAKWLKSPLRNRLSEDTLLSIMMIRESKLEEVHFTKEFIEKILRVKKAEIESPKLRKDDLPNEKIIDSLIIEQEIKGEKELNNSLQSIFSVQTQKQ